MMCITIQGESSYLHAFYRNEHYYQLLTHVGSTNYTRLSKYKMLSMYGSVALYKIPKFIAGLYFGVFLFYFIILFFSKTMTISKKKLFLRPSRTEKMLYSRIGKSVVLSTVFEICKNRRTSNTLTRLHYMYVSTPYMPTPYWNCSIVPKRNTTFFGTLSELWALKHGISYFFGIYKECDHYHRYLYIWP